MRGTPDKRDREIEVIQGSIAKAAAIGVSAIRYHWRMVNDYRNHTVEGPGGRRETAAEYCSLHRWSTAIVICGKWFRFNCLLFKI